MRFLFLIVSIFLVGCDSQPTVVFPDKVSFFVEIADTPTEQAKGLMFRKSLCETCGMLFDFHQEKKIGMWMKDTEISLDMVFMNAQKEIVFIAEKTTPFSLEVIMTEEPIRYVLEVRAGSVAKYKITQSDSVMFKEY